MSKRRGVSAEEKRQRMLDLFYEKKEFFQLKELEKLGPKEKGVVAQSVKEIIQNLVDDNLVETEKIGTSVYFWAFPSKAANTRKRRLADLKAKLEEVVKKRKTVETKVQDMQVGREDSEDRRDVLVKLNDAEQKKKELLSKIEKFKDCDPDVLNKKKEDSLMAKQAANRWTDNIFSIKSWCRNKFMIEEATLNKQFGISEDMDYLP